MLEKCAISLTNWLVVNGTINEDEKELYVYASQSLFLLMLPVLMAMIIGIILGEVVNSIFLVIPFMMIRKFSGGYHANSSSRCFVYSWIILFVFVYLAVHISWSFILGLITLCASMSLCVFSPIDSENRKLEKEEKEQYKKYIIILNACVSVVIILLILRKQNSIACSLALGIIMTAGLQVPCILGIIKSKVEYYMS